MNFAKRYVLLPAALAIIVTWTVAAPQAANPKNMIATDGMIEIEDGRHCQILARQMPFQPGESLTLTTSNGRIEVGAWDKDELIIVADKSLRRRARGIETVERIGVHQHTAFPRRLIRAGPRNTVSSTRKPVAWLNWEDWTRRSRSAIP
jgi:hypothetical protein